MDTFGSYGLAHLHRQTWVERTQGTVFECTWIKKSRQPRLPFINKHQSILCWTRVSNAVVDKNYSIWFWRLQAQLKIHRFAKEQSQGQRGSGQVFWIRLICWGKTEKQQMLTDDSLQVESRNCSLYLLQKTQPSASLSSTLYKPFEMTDVGKVEAGVLTM